MPPSENNTKLLRPNMPELDLLRGVAVIMVVLFHAFFWTANQSSLYQFHGLGKIVISVIQGGWLGVQLFFVLSGLLITGILLDTKQRPDFYKRFYFRRALRILPAYFALLCLLLILGIARPPFILTCILFVSNISVLFGVVLQYAPLWTLAVEEQFYLLWPQAVKRLSLKATTVLAIFIIVATPILRLIAFLKFPAQDLYHYTWFVADGLAYGALIAIYLRTKNATRQKVKKIGVALVAVGAATLLVGLPFGIMHRTNIIGATFQILPWNFLFSGIVLLMLIIGTSKFKDIIMLKWLKYFGYISYGLYLINLLVFYEFDKIINYFSPALNDTLHQTISGLMLRFLIAGGIAVLIAGLSRKYFEAYFLKLKDKLSWSKN